MMKYMIFTVMIFISSSSLSLKYGKQLNRASTCDQETLDRSFVTQCGPSSCEPLFDGYKANETPNEWPSSRDEVVQIVSSRQNYRLKVIRTKAIDTDEYYYEENHVNGTMFADTGTKFQRILGFGTTLSDASCKNIDDLPNEIRQKLVDDYFNPEVGIGLNLLRVPIGSTKYSYSNYVLEQPDANQVELSPYDLDHRIPLIKDAMQSAGRLKNRIKIIASSNGAPPEMKQNNKVIHGGRIKSDKFNDYASYLVAFASAYKSQGLSIWSLLVSEDPATNDRIADPNDVLDFNSLAMRPSDSIRLVKAIRKAQSKDSDKFRLLLLNDDPAYIPVWADALLRQSDIASELAGIAYSCNYSGSTYDNLAYTARRYPNKFLLATQSANNAPLRLGDWQYGENYATELVKNLEYGAVGWIDFNMALNLEGGPSISSRFTSDASVVVDPKKGVYYRNPMFYAIAHLSRYVKPGSIRVKLTFHTSPHMYACQHIAFITPDNYLVVFVSNNNIGPMPLNLGYDKRTKVQALLDTKSFNTFIFRI
jgi:glucosylceramidase